MNPKDKLVPLPMGDGLAPVSAPKDAIAATPIADVDNSLSLTESWMAEHPADVPFDENAAPAKVEPPIPLETDDETPAPDTAPPTTDEPAVAEKPVPDVAPTEPTAPVAEKPVAEQPKAQTYEPDEKFALAEGVEWTRSQVVEALKERATLQPIKAEADTFNKTFRMNAEQAEKVWGPVVERLIADPSIGTFFQGYIDDPDKKAYLDECGKYYDTEVPAAARPVAPAAAPVDPVVRQQLQELQTWKAQRDNEMALSRFNDEVRQVGARYPFVVSDPQLFEDLKTTAAYLYSQDKNKGMLDALALKAPMYDALAIARNTQQEQPAAVAAAPQTLPSPGAAPGASRRSPNTRSQKFADTDEATAAWLASHPSDFSE